MEGHQRVIETRWWSFWAVVSRCQWMLESLSTKSWNRDITCRFHVICHRHVKPLTPTRKTPTPGSWVGVLWVGVRVGLAYPRVTRAIPYLDVLDMQYQSCELFEAG